MDYKQEYIKLKNRLLNNQVDYSPLDQNFTNELSNLVFVVDDIVLGDDVHAVILSLIKQFNKISSSDIPHNIELSQYYAVGKGLMSRQGTTICENCELILKYNDNNVCLSNGKSINDQNVKCDINRGVINFFIKQKKGNTCLYTKVKVVRISHDDNLESYEHTKYFDNDEIEKINEAGNIAINRGQSDVILSNAKGGQLESKNPTEILDSTNNVEYIFDESKKASLAPLVGRMNNSRVTSNVPTQSTVNTANTVASHLAKTKAMNTKDLSAVLVPGKNAILLNNTVLPVDANIDGTQGTIHLNNIQGENTVNSKNINSRAAINVDANLALLPTKDIVANKNIQVTEPSQKSSTSLYNNIVGYLSSLFNKTENAVSNIGADTKSTFNKVANETKSTVNTATNNTGNVVSTIGKKIGETTNKISNFFTGNKPVSVVPVSKDLSVLTPLPPQTAGQAVPVPLNDVPLSSRNMTSSQKTSIRRLNNMVLKNYANTLSMENSKIAASLANNRNEVTPSLNDLIETARNRNKNLY
ncbi:hypothetical protein QJ854_gp643 [Moumouvirus goulette]|uniref:Uncharacterized protein n=1 Tax=Moumouvirus goulette TaxID=1247379 RepID=M1PB65_9VIRU|nr:hypothetical protein QJ854_gp643 [Moumouvirus goulette]AGF85139.1 hypothetical protein glt_00330 [Moumouvirus goulette]